MQAIIKTIRFYAISGAISKAAVVVVVAGALALGDGSISIQWGQ